VLLSSGIIVDRTSFLTELGEPRMQECPVTRASIQPNCFPVVMMKRKLTNWRVICFDKAIELATKLGMNCPGAYEKACLLAESILVVLGEDVYVSRSGRLAKLLIKNVESKQPME
jgi:hypothetical protein